MRQHVWLQFAGLLPGLGWRVLGCATWFSPMCRALPQGPQRALFSLLQVLLRFSGHRVSVLLLPWCRGLGLALPFFYGLLLLRLLAGVVGVCTLCPGAPVAVMSAWFAGEVTLLLFPYLRVGVLLAFGVSGVCGLRRRSRLPLLVRHPFPVSVGLSPFLGLGWFGHRFVAPPATPRFWTLLILGCDVLAP